MVALCPHPTPEATPMAPILFSTLLLVPPVSQIAPLAFKEAYTCLGPGKGRHRRVAHARRAARGEKR